MDNLVCVYIWIDFSFLQYSFYDFFVFDFEVCMIFLGLCSCVFLMGLHDFLDSYDFLDLTCHLF